MKKLIIFSLLIINTIGLHAAQPLELSNWDLNAINASRLVYSKNVNNITGQKPLYLSPVIRDQHLTFLHHTTFEIFSEHQVGELAGAPVYGSKGHYVYITSKDGWVSKYNMQTGMPEIKIRAGLQTANSALSGNGRFLLVGNRQPADLVFLNADDLSVERLIPVQDRKGNLSPVTVVRNAGELHGFIVIPKNFPQLWKVSYLDPPPIGFGDGWNHDYRCLKDHMDKPLFPIKRLRIEQTLSDLYIDKDNIFLIASIADKKGIVFDLDLSRIVGRPELSSLAPELIWQTNKADQLAILSDKNTLLSFYNNHSHPGQWKKESGLYIDHATAIAACPQEKIIWIGDHNGEIRLVNKLNHSIEHILALNYGSINKIACTPDKKYTLVTAGDKNKKLIIYDNKKQKIIRQ